MKIKLLFCTLLMAASSYSQNIPALDVWMDKWHKSAAETRFDDFFAEMDDDFIYLGTAPGERWTKIQFANFCKPHFDAGEAWTFVSNTRFWTFSDNKKIAWFEEDLDTWMGGCRGTGVAVKKKGKWYLKQYNLTVLIENDLIDAFIELRYGE
ncbi:MAG: nuclear transport factor 2 family protein [Bacteroidota bacterium]